MRLGLGNKHYLRRSADRKAQIRKAFVPLTELICAFRSADFLRWCLFPKRNLTHNLFFYFQYCKTPLRPAGSDPEVVCQKKSFLKVSVSLGGFGPSVAHGKHSVRRRCVQATKNKAETCSLLDAIGRRSCGR